MDTPTLTPKKHPTNRLDPRGLTLFSIYISNLIFDLLNFPGRNENVKNSTNGVVTYGNEQLLKVIYATPKQPHCRVLLFGTTSRRVQRGEMRGGFLTYF